jgi:hypothetical protein
MTVRSYEKAKTDDGVTDRDGQGSTKLRRKNARKKGGQDSNLEETKQVRTCGQAVGSVAISPFHHEL